MASGGAGNDLGAGPSGSSGQDNPLGQDNPPPDNSSFSSEYNTNQDTDDGYESDDSSRTMTQESYLQDLQQQNQNAQQQQQNQDTQQQQRDQDEELYEDTVGAISAYSEEYLEAYGNLNNQERQEIEQRVREFVDRLPDIKNK